MAINQTACPLHSLQSRNQLVPHDIQIVLTAQPVAGSLYGQHDVSDSARSSRGILHSRLTAPSADLWLKSSAQGMAKLRLFRKVQLSLCFGTQPCNSRSLEDTANFIRTESERVRNPPKYRERFRSSRNDELGGTYAAVYIYFLGGPGVFAGGNIFIFWLTTPRRG